MKRLLSRLAFILLGAAVVGVVGYNVWFADSGPPAQGVEQELAPAAKTEVLEISPQARKNLGLVVKPLALTNYWKTIQIPGAVIDRPGRTDRGVTSPIAGVIAAVHAFPGETVQPGDVLFSIRLASEYVQTAQAELFKAVRDVELLQEQKSRLDGLTASGAIPRARVIEIEQEMSRKMAAVEALRHDLKVRGLSSAQIELAQRGDFVTEITVFAPSGSDERIEGTAVNAASDLDKSYRSFGKVFEVQELSVELGEQVAMGANLCLIADLESLFVEGHAFKQDAHFLERAVQQDWPIRIEFSESIDNRWPPLDQSFQIQHLANAVDPDSRTFAVLIPLTNQYRTYQKDGKEHVVWRFRPGERVRLHISVEELSDVFVLPAAGVARDGPEAYVFRQNGDLFNRLPVHVMCEDRVSVVVANDGDLRAGFYIAQNAAASLNRVLKAQAASGTPVGMHVHADGTIHGGH